MTHKKSIEVKRLVKTESLTDDDDCVYEALNQCHVSNSAVGALITTKEQTQEIGSKTQLI